MKSIFGLRLYLDDGKGYELLKKNISSLQASVSSSGTKTQDKLRKDFEGLRTNFSSSVKDSNTLAVNFSNLKKNFSSSMKNISTSLKHFNDDIGVLSATVQGYSAGTTVGSSTGFHKDL